MGHPYWISVVFFLLAGAPGFWMPALSNVLRGHELAGYVEPAFMIPGIAALISPLIFAAQVDQRLQAQKVLGVILIAGSVFLYYAFVAVEEGWGGSWFLLLMSINALISAPSWSLLTMITLSNTPESGKSFGLYRVWGTLGWMVAGFLVSWWALDPSPSRSLADYRKDCGGSPARCRYDLFLTSSDFTAGWASEKSSRSSGSRSFGHV